MNNQNAPDLRDLIRVLADKRKPTLERLGSLRALMLSLEDIEATLVSTARAEGLTWDAIRTAMQGVTRPELQKRYGIHGEEPSGDG